MKVQGAYSSPAQDPVRTQRTDLLYVKNKYGAPALGGIVHGFKQREVRRAAEKIFMADAMWYAINEYGVLPLYAGGAMGWNGADSNYDLVGERPHSTSGGGGNDSTGKAFN